MAEKKFEKPQSYEQRKKWQYWLPILKKDYHIIKFGFILIGKVLIILNYKKNAKIKFFNQSKITNIATYSFLFSSEKEETKK